MWTNEVFTFIRQHGVVSVVLGGLIEQVIVPIPSPLVPMAAGFLFVSPLLAFWPAAKDIFLKAALPFAIGSTLGSTMVYCRILTTTATLKVFSKDLHGCFEF